MAILTAVTKSWHELRHHLEQSRNRRESIMVIECPSDKVDTKLARFESKLPIIQVKITYY